MTMPEGWIRALSDDGWPISHAVALDQMHGEYLPPVRPLTLLEPGAQHFGGRLRKLVQRLSDGGQRRGDQAGDLEIVEADDGYVAGDMPVVLVKEMEHARRDLIGMCEETIDLGVLGEHFVRGFDAVPHGVGSR
ncbi:MAG: hypothetical protein L0K48_07685, partial [Bifidobacterium mongoliense]|nr:hypothetical protein [Bifidobacterium mongoliense]